MQNGYAFDCPKCPLGTNAKLEKVKNCQTGKDTLETRCENPCATVLCLSGTECITVPKKCANNSNNCEPGLQVECTNKCINIGNPCVNFSCPIGQGCYLKRTLTESSCKLTAYCEDPCLGVTCPCGEYCYTQNVKCKTLPCNPQTVCRKPCDNVKCENGGTCYVPNVLPSCICPPCRPKTVCV